MSAIARYYKRQGYEVSGYDRTPSELTAQLEVEGIGVHYEDRPDLLPANTADTLVIYTPAVPEDLQELVRARSEGYRLIKRSRALGELTNGQFTLAVAGTHGKTTTSTLTAHILENGGKGCSAFLGGIALNYNTNYLLSDNNIVVTEADEFDRSFLQLHPQLAVITAMDADHLDIYGNLETMQDAYRQFASQVSDAIVAKKGLPLDASKLQAKLYSYACTDHEADFHAENLRLSTDGHYTFDIVHPNGAIHNIRCGTLGMLNVENSVAAAALCLLCGESEENIRKGIECFKGVKRRMEEHVNTPKVTYIDDYAHHPAEIAGSLRTIKTIFAGRRITAIFQPHLYTRTRDFAPEFARALSHADEVVLTDIYPAREEPIEGVTSDLIFKDLTCGHKSMVAYSELTDWVKTHDVDVLVTFGAGNIDRLVEKISQTLEEK